MSPVYRLAVQSCLNDHRCTGRRLSSRVCNICIEDTPGTDKNNEAKICWDILFAPDSSIFHKRNDAMKIDNQLYVDKHTPSS
jgi:hypothetical protein